jgi:7-keto-8-aminopelargonate synthetase-like enzyme
MNLSPHHPALDFVDATHVRVGRRTLLYFGGSNYLGLSRHPRVLSAMRDALDAGAVQPGASRATTGEHRLYRDAERALARHFRQPAAALVSCGYLAPLAAVHTLRSRCTHLLLDDRAHACVQDAAALAGRPITRFAHANITELRRRLRELPRGSRPLLLADGMAGSNGGITPLGEYLEALPKLGWLLVDDAHGAGIVGPGGRGAVAYAGLDDPRIVQTISLAKAFGVSGGAVLGSAEIIAELRRSSPPFVGSTALPLAVPAGLLAAIRVLAAEPERVSRLQAHMKWLHDRLPAHPAISCHPATPVIAVLPSSAAQARAMADALRRAGIYPSFIRYLNHSATGFFRFALCSEHPPADVELLASAIRKGVRAPSS